MSIGWASGGLRCNVIFAQLHVNSAIPIANIMTLDRAQLTERLGQLSAGLMREIDDGLRQSLALDDGR